MTKSHRVLLLGATGLTGHHCLRYLLADPRVERVNLLTRRPLTVADARVNGYLFSRPESEQAELFEVDTVICCLGTTRKKAGSKAAFRAVDYTLCVDLAKRAKRAGVTTFTLVSAVNANAKSMSFYARTKGDTEQALRALAFPRLLLARPSLLLGTRAERRWMENLGQAVLRPAVPVVKRILPGSTPIEAQQLANALVNASLQPPAMGVVVLRYPELMAYIDPP